MIAVTKPFLPPKEEYIRYVDQIWNRKWLTNNGPLVNEFELKLKEYLGANHLLFVSNGTFAIQLAIKGLELTGEIITTPFSFIATSSSIVWENITPVFADIKPDTFNIDPTKIESLITDKTSAIVATHVYGNPCDMDALKSVADKHGLKIIYDAAHCFGVKYKGNSIFNNGDVSTTSFHATKLFHTIEGGGIYTQSAELLKKLAVMKNFGLTAPDEYGLVGVNGKNSEFHAAMGLCNLNHIDEILARRKELYTHYLGMLGELKVSFQKITPGTEYNHSYMPVLFESQEVCEKVNKELMKAEIYARRYFRPTLDQAKYFNGPSNVPIAHDISSRILCLPLYHDLTVEEVDYVCRLIHRTLRYN